MGKAELLADLRERTKSIELPAKEFWQAPDSLSVAKGIVVELLGNARTEWLLRFFCLHPSHYIFWCEREPLINPTAIHQRGVGLERIKFVNSGGDLQQILRLALESKFYPFVLAPNRLTDIKSYQRLSLLAEKSKSTVFLLADKSFSSAWPISLQLDINFSDRGLSVDIQRQKQKQEQEAAPSLGAHDGTSSNFHDGTSSIFKDGTSSGLSKISPQGFSEEDSL